MSMILGKIEQLTNDNLLDEVRELRRYLWTKDKVYMSKDGRLEKAYCHKCAKYSTCRDCANGITIVCDEFLEG